MPFPLLFLLLVLLLLLLHLPAALPSTTAGLPPLSLSPPPFWLPVVVDGAAHVLEGSSELTTRAAAAATAYQFVLSLGLLAAGWDAAERAEMVRTLTAFVESGEGRLWSAGACAPVSPTDGPGGEPTPRPSTSTSSSSTSPGAVDGPLLVLPVAHYARDEDDGARARSRGEIAGAPPRQRPSASDSGSHQPQMRATLLHHCPNASALETASAFVRDHHGIPAGAEIPATLAGAVAAIEVEVARRLRDLHRQTRAFAATSCAARTNSRTDSGTGSSADSSSSTTTTTSRTGINSNSNSNSNSARPPRRTPSAATSPFVSATAEVARGLVEARELPTFVINLRTSSARLEHVHCQLSAAGFALVRAPGTDTDSDNDNVNNANTEEDGTAGMRHPVRRFLAVDGATLTERVLRRVLFSPSPSKERGGESPSSPSSPPTQPPLPQLTQGEVGVALSHISLWKQVAVEDVPFALILEDDVHLRAGTRNMLLERIGALVAAEVQWDIIFLDCDAGGGLNYGAEAAREYGAGERCVAAMRRAAARGHGLVKLDGCCAHSSIASYVVSRRGALKLAAGALPLSAPVDVFLHRMVDEQRLDAFCTAPHLAWTRVDTVQSDLRDGDRASTVRLPPLPS